MFEEEDDGTSVPAIAALEARLGSPLPSDYKSFIRTRRAGDLRGRFVCPIPDECVYAESWVEVNEIVGVYEQEDALEMLAEWEHPVRGLVLDRMDGHRMLILALGDALLPRGTVALTDLENDPTGPSIIVLAPTFQHFIERLRNDDAALDAAERVPPTEIVLTDATTDADLRAKIDALRGRAIAVQTIVLRGRGISNEGLAALMAVKRLEALDVAQTSVTLDGLLALRGRPIADLTVTDTPTTLDVAGASALREALGWLVRLRARREQVTDPAREWFEQRWPGLELHLVDARY